MYEEIKKMISSKNNSIDNQTLVYFTNYFYCLAKDNLISQKIKLESLIDNAMKYASKIEFYDENHRVYLENGSDTKGFRDSDAKTIFIRANLEEPLKKITVYHELHHAVQTNPHNDEVGINQKSNIGRLIMEAQTQYFAEKIYQEIHGVTFEERQIPTENLRMAGNGIVTSKLHNYEMYDNLLSKLAIMLDVSKDYFVSINFLYENNEGLKNLEAKYNEAKKKYKLPYSFEETLLMLDYIYCVDLIAYKDNPDKETILSGKETESFYQIYPEKDYKLSQQTQKGYINSFDVDNFLALVDSGGNYKEFGRLVIDCEKRKIISQFIEPPSGKDQGNTHKRR